MKRLFLATVVLASALSSAHAAPLVSVVSDFENAALGLDGWTVIGDPAAGSPVRVASGGNPGGFIQVADAGTGAVMNWVAPAKFSGNLSAFFGGTFSYDMRQTPVTSLFLPGPAGDIAIVGTAGTLIYSLPATVADYPQANFTTRTLGLNDQTAWRLGTASGALASNAQIQSVLDDVTALRIRAEYSLNLDVNALDNVVLRNGNAHAVPEPSSAALVLGAVALLAGLRRRRPA